MILSIFIGLERRERKTIEQNLEKIITHGMKNKNIVLVPFKKLLNDINCNFTNKIILI